jgi:hypothetical protein
MVKTDLRDQWIQSAPGIPKVWMRLHQPGDIAKVLDLLTLSPVGITPSLHLAAERVCQ